MSSGESGFGSPTFVPAAAYPDAGFGSPFDADFNALARDTGFGSPSAPVLYAADGGIAEVSVEGGSKLRIFGPFTAGRSYDVSIANGLLLYPCFSGVNTSGPSGLCLRNGVLTTYTTALAAGLYDIQVDFGGGVIAVLSEVVKALPPITNAETYIMRKYFQPTVAAGDRDARLDRRNISNLGGLLSAIGSLFNELSGKPNTFVRTAYAYGDSELEVRSTLTFPSSGVLHVGGQVLSYTAKTDTTFTGVTPLAVNLHQIDVNTEVSLDD